MIRILVAEDDRPLNKLVCAALEGNGYQPIACYDGAQAIAAFDENGADLVVTDIMMPQADGFALAEHVRGNDAAFPFSL